MSAETSLLVLVALGAAHGLNPGMGWLFAVGLGLQEQDRRAVWRALGPLALGHALAVGAAVALAAVVGLVLPLRQLRWVVAAALLGFGLFHLLRHRHPRFGGMRVGARDLTIWSFLMASAHGAGIMVLPFVLGVTHSAATAGSGPHAGHMMMAGMPGAQAMGLLGTLAHSLGYLTVAGIIAFVVYEKLGLRLLRSAWLNLNLVWAVALAVTAVVTLAL